MKISCALAPCTRTPHDIVLAEELGYYRAWCFDSPALYADTWMTLARAAERTTSIGLGPAVLVPSLRHVMASAAAIATLVALAPERVAVTIGSGFSGRLALGDKAMRWSDVADYIHTLSELLAGREVCSGGAVLKMLQPAETGLSASHRVPLLVAADGPKGFAVAKEFDTGLMTAGSIKQHVPVTPWRAACVFGAVVPESGSAQPLTGHPGAVAAAMFYHVTYSRADAAVDRLPGGRRWRDSVESVAPEVRHLAVNEGHMVALNGHDQLIAEELQRFSNPIALVGTHDRWRELCRRYAEAGVSELVFQPAGTDVARQLSDLAAAVIS